ncbi:MAG: hypothetical protein NVS3B21_15680 [Acidimicrobiales bacterium]
MITDGSGKSSAYAGGGADARDGGVTDTGAAADGIDRDWATEPAGSATAGADDEGAAADPLAAAGGGATEEWAASMIRTWTGDASL